MRPREEIRKDLRYEQGMEISYFVEFELILEVLLDIRDLLDKKSKL